MNARGDNMPESTFSRQDRQILNDLIHSIKEQTEAIEDLSESIKELKDESK